MAFARPSPAALSETLAALRARLGERFSDVQAVREQHGNMLSEVPNQPPDAVVFPKTTDEVAEIVRVCAARRVPVIAFGTGTSFEGHLNAPFGGVSVDTSLMKQVLEVNADDLDCRVEAGVTREELNAAVRTSGLFFPIDPGANASLGGMTATRASGTNAVRYGTMRDAVLSLTVVMADGSVAVTGSRARKSSAGYDMTRLMIGSEGTLGIITEIGLKLWGLPEEISASVCGFETIKNACDAVILTIQSGIPVARIEFLDALQVKACNTYSKLDLPETPVLFLEFHGSPASVAEQAQRFSEIAGEFGGRQIAQATRPEDRTRLWKARHDAYWAARALRPTAKGISTDVCVPISRLADCVEATKADAESCGLLAPIVGHVGDGNFHVMPLVDFSDAIEVAKGRAFVDRLVERSVSLGGTITGEHGIGQSNARYMPLEFSDIMLSKMQAVKQALDPDGIMNPGKILPER
jgi:D-lactate dehydrogenase (cytochrome)